jgi:hypothetical protein
MSCLDNLSPDLTNSNEKYEPVLILLRKMIIKSNLIGWTGCITDAICTGKTLFEHKLIIISTNYIDHYSNYDIQILIIHHIAHALVNRDDHSRAWEAKANKIDGFKSKIWHEDVDLFCGGFEKSNRCFEKLDYMLTCKKKCYIITKFQYARSSKCQICKSCWNEY